MSADPRCPSCRGPLAEGFVPDVSHGQVLQSHWHPGAPEEYRFFGIPAGTRIDRKGMIPIRAWRCSSCGLVQLFAQARPKT